jgi:hypothetical protein
MYMLAAMNGSSADRSCFADCSIAVAAVAVSRWTRRRLGFPEFPGNLPRRLVP